MMTEFRKRSPKRDGPAMTMPLSRTISSYQVSAGGRFWQFLGRDAGAGGEEVHVAFERGFEQHLGRIADRIRAGFEAGGDDPDQRQQGDDGVEDDQQTGDPVWSAWEGSVME